MRRLKKEEDQTYYKNSGKALPRLGDDGKIPGDIPHLRHHRDDGPNTDGAGKLVKTVNGLIIRGMSLKTYLVQKLQWLIRWQQTQLTVTDGMCEEYTS